MDYRKSKEIKRFVALPFSGLFKSNASGTVIMHIVSFFYIVLDTEHIS